MSRRRRAGRPRRVPGRGARLARRALHRAVPRPRVPGRPGRGLARADARVEPPDGRRGLGRHRLARRVRRPGARPRPPGRAGRGARPRPARPARSTRSAWPTSRRRSWPSAPTRRRTGSSGPMLRGDEIWCQGFSEPDAGSDLASLADPAPSATATAGSINGQKVWNTFGQLADWCELLARTDPTASKHQGISCFVVDMSLPGIEVRPLRTATGDADFCEIFFDDVRIGPTRCSARSRGLDGGDGHAHVRAQRGRQPAHLDPPPHRRADRRRSARPAAPTTRGPPGAAALWSRGRAPAAAVGTRPPPGPAGPRPRARVEPDQDGVEPGRPGGAARRHPDPRPRPRSRATGASGSCTRRSLTIAGGTTEVNRNIIAERVLGLPRDPADCRSRRNSVSAFRRTHCVEFVRAARRRRVSRSRSRWTISLSVAKPRPCRLSRSTWSPIGYGPQCQVPRAEVHGRRPVEHERAHVRQIGPAGERRGRAGRRSAGRAWPPAGGASGWLDGAR